MAAANPPENVLGSISLSRIISAILPRDLPSDTSQIRTPHDAIAVAAHACFLAVGFRLIGLGEDHRIENPIEASENTPTVDLARQLATQPLPTMWNSNGAHYQFRYKHSQSSMEYLLQVNRMGGKAIILAMGLGDDKTATIEIPVTDFTSEGNIPANPTTDTADIPEIRSIIANVFINIGRLSDFGSMMRVKIIQRLIPGLSKAGYAETNHINEENTQAGQSAAGQENRRQDREDFDPRRGDQQPYRPYMPLEDPLVQPPRRRPIPDPMPGFEDEHEILRPPRGGIGGVGGPRIGDRDLYPAGLGPNDPFRGSMGPGLGGGGGGMHPTFDDPLFTGQGRGNGGFDPQAPPGARFDQVGPGAGHPRGSGMGGRPPNPFGGFSDSDFL